MFKSSLVTDYISGDLLFVDYNFISLKVCNWKKRRLAAEIPLVPLSRALVMYIICTNTPESSWRACALTHQCHRIIHVNLLSRAV